MKLLLTLVCLVSVSLPFQANAARKDWGVQAKHGDSADVNASNNDFADVYSFTIPVSIGKVNQSHTFVVTIDEIKDFAERLVGDHDGKSRDRNRGKGNRVDRLTELLVANLSSALRDTTTVSSQGSPLVVNSPAQVLAPTESAPVVVQTPEPVKVVSTPIPAAMWLFGTAFMGLLGVKRRKAIA